MQRAIAAYHRGDWIDAENLCRAVLAAKADHSDGLHLLGTLAVQTGRPREASELLARAVAINPRDAELHNTHGVALRDAGRPPGWMPDEPLRSVRYPEAHANRGVVLRNLERHDEALQSYDRGGPSSPTSPGARQSRRRAERARSLPGDRGYGRSDPSGLSASVRRLVAREDADL
jgi:Tfp pilus assembly protein PilF